MIGKIILGVVIVTILLIIILIAASSSSTFVKSKAFWGTGDAGEGPAATSSECQKRCRDNPKCTGATFNSDKQYCWQRTGLGSLVSALPNDYGFMK
jgi:hypothetical protein